MSDPTPTPVPAPAPTAPATPPATPAPAPGATPELQYPDGLGDPGTRALDAEREARRAAETKLAEFEAARQADEDAKLSELDRFRKQAQELQASDSAKDSVIMRMRFAMENQVPTAWVDRLKGNTAEELAADWATLQPTLVPPVPPVDPNAPRVPSPVPNPGPQPGPPQSEDDLLYEQIYGSAKK
jgi:hypothetical protein